ncbi:uncharacterized protein [Eurosta solidaginis]|uniref:uncharacterized protein isoform X2 n=1 Tax=Eurosta solidaginis TaxID=178769 RepID=UPI003530E4D7
MKTNSDNGGGGGGDDDECVAFIGELIVTKNGVHTPIVAKKVKQQQRKVEIKPAALCTDGGREDVFSVCYDVVVDDDEETLERRQYEVLANLLGDNGRWQAIWCCLLSAFQGASTFHIFCYVFQTAVKDFWCARPDNAPDMDVSLWRNLSQPVGACSILNLNYSQLPDLLPLNILGSSQLIPCTKFEFSSEEIGARSIVEEFDLVCSRKELISVMEMSFLAGAALGSVSSGWISDRFGRKHTLMAFVLVQIVAGTLVAYSINTTMFMSLRVISGFASMTVTVVSFVLVVELVSGKWRTITGILNIVPIPISYILMACIAYFVRDWRNLQLIVSLPWLSFLLIWYCMPESPRWLLAQGRLNELYSLVERAARLNHRILPPNYRKTLEAAAPPPLKSRTTQTNHSNEQTILQQQQQQQQLPAFMVSAERATNNCGAINPDANEANPTTHDNPLRVVFNRFYWRTTCLNLIVWLTLIIIYYGLTLHLSNLGGNIYLNNIVGGALEALSVLISIFVVLKVGLRRSLIAYMLVPGVLCLATNLLSTRDENQLPVVTMAIIAKCIIGANNAIIPSYTAMQYPTVVRNFGVGLGNLAAGIALILVPYMWLLIIAGAVEALSVCSGVFVVLKVGLRRSLIGYMLAPGVLCLGTNALPTRDEDQLWPLLIPTLLAIFSMLLLMVQAQGPFPPRLSIPGAVPVGGPAVPVRPQFRNDKLARVRRPVALRAQNAYIPSAAPRIQEESKPVTESNEDEQPDVFLPQLLREQQLAQVHQQQFQQQANAFLNSDANSIQDSPSITQFSQDDDSIFASSPQTVLPTTRFPERPTPAAPITTTPSYNRPVFNDYSIGSFGGTQRFSSDSPQRNAPTPAQPQRINVIRSRPQLREQRPQYEAQTVPQPAPQRSRPRPAPAPRPAIEYNQVQQDEREHAQNQNRRTRPVAQTTRKWREENEDGSITWGYENDDGSFKEELIGTDCITKGTYGYIDPDGNKREYHYETGIKCDPNTRETEEELQHNGFVNYEQNTAVLPNGIEIDMAQLGKKKSKRPNSIYRN